MPIDSAACCRLASIHHHRPICPSIAIRLRYCGAGLHLHAHAVGKKEAATLWEASLHYQPAKEPGDYRRESARSMPQKINRHCSRPTLLELASLPFVHVACNDCKWWERSFASNIFKWNAIKYLVFDYRIDYW